MRGATVRGFDFRGVSVSMEPGDRYTQELGLLAMSTIPPDVELSLRRKPSQSIVFSPIAQPMGPRAPLEKLVIVDNPKIPRNVESRATGDLRASEGLQELHGLGYDVYYLQELFSAGVLGISQKRRLVPTRWAITAVDDIIGRFLIKKVRGLPELGEIRVHFTENLGNRLGIILLPSQWAFEQLEAWIPGNVWTGKDVESPIIINEGESIRGRTSYALKSGGGYYASRLAVLEHLARDIGRQSRAIVIREVGPEYWLPVGVWEVRENVRLALRQQGIRVSTLKEVSEILSPLFRIPIDRYFQETSPQSTFSISHSLDEYF
jgi:hypothetical protein